VLSGSSDKMVFLILIYISLDMIVYGVDHTNSYHFIKLSRFYKVSALRLCMVLVEMVYLTLLL